MPEPPQLPPIATQPLSVLLLGRSDQPGHEEALSDWIAYLNSLEREYEILLLDSAPLDRTEELAKRHPDVRVVRDLLNRGVGATLRFGLAEAKHPLLMYAPCDRQYQPKNLRLLLDEIDKTHVVVGHRVGRRVPFVLRALGFVGRGIVRVLFGVPLESLPAWLGWRDHARNLLARALFAVRLHDVQCDFRLFRRCVFRRIPIQSDGPFVHIEILAKANFLAAVMTEVPLAHQPAPTPSSWWQDFRRVFGHPDFGPVVLPDEQEAAPPPAPSPNGPVEPAAPVAPKTPARSEDPDGPAEPAAPAAPETPARSEEPPR